MTQYIGATDSNFISAQERARLVRLCAIMTGSCEAAEDLADLASMRRERANALADGVSRIAGFIGAPSLSCLSLVGTLVFSALGHRLPRQLTLGVGFTIGGAVRYWILLAPFIPLLVIVYAIAGLGIAPINPLIDTVLQERTPTQMRA